MSQRVTPMEVGRVAATVLDAVEHRRGRQARGAAAGAGRHPGRRPRAAGGPAGAGQDADRPLLRPGARAGLPAAAVHARPAAGRRHRLVPVRPAHATSSPSGPARSSPTCCWPTRSTGRRRRPRPRCSRRCRRSRSRSRAPRTRCSRPFHVLATANPIEHEGTYPLPEAQLDRFLMRVSFGYPDRRTRSGTCCAAGWPAAARRSVLEPVVDTDTLLAMQARAGGRDGRGLGRALHGRAHRRDPRPPAGTGRRLAARLAGADAARPRGGRDGRPGLRRARGRQGGRGGRAGPPDHAAPGDVAAPGRRRPASWSHVLEQVPAPASAALPQHGADASGPARSRVRPAQRADRRGRPEVRRPGRRPGRSAGRCCCTGRWCCWRVVLGRLDLVALAAPFALGTAWALRATGRASRRSSARSCRPSRPAEGGDVRRSVRVGQPEPGPVRPGRGPARHSPWLPLRHGDRPYATDLRRRRAWPRSSCTGAALRWGRHDGRPGQRLRGRVRWPAAQRAGPQRRPASCRVHPRAAAVPGRRDHAAGRRRWSGVHRSRRPGEGGELAGVRRYGAG